MGAPILIRTGTQADLPAILDLWVEAWTHTMPEIDFAARREWLAERQRSLIAEGAIVLLIEQDKALVGYALVNRANAYLDQIAVAPASWGDGIAQTLLGLARDLCPRTLSLHVNRDNARAIRFYEREGFVRMGEGINPRSGLPIYHYTWTASLPGASAPN